MFKYASKIVIKLTGTIVNKKLSDELRFFSVQVLVQVTGVVLQLFFVLFYHLYSGAVIGFYLQFVI